LHEVIFIDKSELHTLFVSTVSKMYYHAGSDVLSSKCSLWQGNELSLFAWSLILLFIV